MSQLGQKGHAPAAKPAQHGRPAAKPQAKPAAKPAAGHPAAHTADPKKAQNAASSKAAQQLGAMHADKGAGLAQQVHEQALKMDVKKIAPHEAQQHLNSLKADLKKARTPADIAKVSAKANELQGRAEVSNDKQFHDSLRQDISHMQGKAAAANQAVQAIEGQKKALHGSDTEKANMAARLLANPKQFSDSLHGLKALKGTELGARSARDLQDVARHATPDTISKALNKNPDLAHYPAEMTHNLATLRQLPDAHLQGAIDKAGEHLLTRPGGISMDTVKANPALGQILAPLAQSKQPGVAQKLNDTVKGWAKQSLEHNLDGKKGEDGVKDALNGFKNEMGDLARKTGLGTSIQAGAEAAANEDKGKINDAAKKHDGPFGFVEDAFSKVSGFVNSTIGSLGSLIGKGIGAIGTVAGKGISVLGKINPVSLTTGLAAKGLDALGAHGAANALDKVHNAVGDAYDFAGKQVENFSKGAGDAVGGMVSGIGQFVTNPVGTVKAMGALVAHPDKLGAMAKAVWSQATKHGVAGALGYITGSAAPMLLSGGAGVAAKGAELADMGANLAGKGGMALNLAGGAARGAGTFLEGAGKVLTSGPVTKTAAVYKSLGELNFSKAVGLLGKDSRTIMGEFDKQAVKTFSSSAKDVGHGLHDLGAFARDAVRHPGDFVQQARQNAHAWRKGVDEATSRNEAVAKTLEQRGLKAEVPLRKAVRDGRLTRGEKFQAVADQIQTLENTRAFRTFKEGTNLLTNPMSYFGGKAFNNRFLAQTTKDATSGKKARVIKEVKPVGGGEEAVVKKEVATELTPFRQTLMNQVKLGMSAISAKNQADKAKRESDRLSALIHDFEHLNDPADS